MEKEPPENKIPNDEDDMPSEEELDQWIKKFWELNDPDKPHETRECPNCGEDMQLLTEPADDEDEEAQYFFCWSCDYAAPPDYDPSDEDDFDEEDDEDDE